jgi:hypothetical protein
VLVCWRQCVKFNRQIEIADRLRERFRSLSAVGDDRERTRHPLASDAVIVVFSGATMEDLMTARETMKIAERKDRWMGENPRLRARGYRALNTPPTRSIAWQGHRGPSQLSPP